MKYLVFTIFSLTMLASCSTPIVIDGGYNDNYGDRYNGYEDGYYRYDSRARTSRYDRYYGTNTNSGAIIGRTRIGRSSGTYNRYDAYSSHGHSLHSSRYRSFHHGHRRHHY